MTHDQVELDEAFVPGAQLEEPLEAHTVEALRMWLDTTYKKVVYSNFQRLAVLTYPFSTAVHSKYVAP